MSWFAAKGLLGLARGWWLLGAALALIGSVWWLSAAEKADDRANQQIGAAGAVIEGQNVTLQQIGEAHAAGNQVRDDRGNARLDQCLRDAAPGFESGCERYRKQQPVPGGPEHPGAPGAGR